MRRTIIVWFAITVVALLLTPPVVSTVELLEDGNIRSIGSLRTETVVRYDLDIYESPLGAFRIDDYYEVRISEPKEVRLVDGTATTAIHIVETERLSEVPHGTDETIPSDAVREIWVDPDTGEVLMDRSQRVHHRNMGDAWQEEVSTRADMVRPAMGIAVERLTTDLILFHSPMNATWVLKALKKVDKDDEVRPADHARTMEGRPVLGIGNVRGSLGDSAAPCALPVLNANEWPDLDRTIVTWHQAWYDWDSVFPYRFTCTADRDATDVLAAVTRSHLSEGDLPFHIERTVRLPEDPAPEAVPWPGLLPGTDVFPYSLPEAHEALVQDEELANFQAFLERSDRYTIERASLHIDEMTNPPPSWSAPVHLLPRQAYEPTYTNFWALRYVNDQGDSIDVTTRRAVQDGTEVTNWDWEIGEAFGRPELWIGLLDSARIIPADRALERAQQDGHPFAMQPGDHYTFRIGIHHVNGGPGLGASHQFSTADAADGNTDTYDAVTGQKTSTSEYQVRPAATPPEAPTEAPQPQATSPRTLTHPAAASAAVAGVSFLAYLAFHGTTIPAALYAKIARSRILDHPRREALHEYLRVNPGASLKEVQDALGIGWGSAVHHVRLLEANGFVTSRRSGRRRRFWVTADKTVPEVRREALLSEETPKRILEELARDPTLSQAALARRLGLARSTVHHHVRHLIDAGLVTSRRDGGTLRLSTDRVPDLPPQPPASIK